MINLQQYKNKIQQYKGKKEFLEKEFERRKTNIDKLQTRSLAIEKAQVFIQNVAKDTQEKIRFHIEDIVQLAIDTCFPNEYEFKMEFGIKRGKTEAELIFVQNENKIDPMDASGGGVVDITSFALRIAAWSLSKTDNIMILDEPFKHLSNDLQSRAGEILKRLSNKLKLQIIMSTHIENIIDNVDRIFEVRRVKKGKYFRSVVEQK